MYKLKNILIAFLIITLFWSCSKDERNDISMLTRAAKGALDIQSEESKKSIKIYTQAMSLKGDSEQTLKKKSNLLDDAIELDEYNYDAYFARGWINKLLGNYSDGIKDYTIFINATGKIMRSSKAFCNRGIIYWDLGKQSNAMQDFNDAIREAESDDNKGRAFYYRGKLKYVNGDKEAACSDWSKAGGYGYTEAYKKMRMLCE